MKLSRIHADLSDKEQVAEHVLDCVLRDFRRYKETGEMPHPSGGWRVQRRDGAFFGGAFGSKPSWSDPYVSMSVVPGAELSAEGRFGYPSLSVRIGQDVDFADQHNLAHLEEIIEHELFVHGRQKPTAAVRSRHLPKQHWKKYAPFRLVDRTYLGWLAYYTRPTEIEAWVEGMLLYARRRSMPLAQVFTERLADIQRRRATELEPDQLVELTHKIHEDWLAYAREIGAL